MAPAIPGFGERPAEARMVGAAYSVVLSLGWAAG
jgi:hypothetical protein